MKCCLSTQDIDRQQAVALAQQWGGLEGVDYVKDVSSHISYQWDADGKDSMPFTIEGTNLTSHTARDKTFKVAAYDFGASYQFSKLRQHGFDVYVFPAGSPPEAVRDSARRLFLSSSGSDPAAYRMLTQTLKHS